MLDGLDLSIAEDDRIGLLGSNGNGKSTFAKLVSGRLDATDGLVRRSSKMKVGFFAQHQIDDLDANETPYEAIARLMPGESEARVRGRAARMGFPNMKANTKVALLSGGEKARLLMGLASFAGPHLLIMDEPTNHLDIDSRAALIEAVNDYEGAIILVSHDRYLLEACADRLWLVDGGTVKSFDGDMDDYKTHVMEKAGGPSRKSKRQDSRQDARQDAREESAAPAAKPAPRPRDVVSLRKRIDDAEARMAKLNALLARLDAALADGSLYVREPTKAGQWARQRTELQKAVAKAEEEWLALNAELERAA